MVYAASKKYIPESQIFKGKLHSANERREEFTREEYRALHTRGRKWKRQARTESSKWYREIVYNFVLVMCNTGMRPPEAKNLRWRDVAISTIRKDTKGRENKTEEVLLGAGGGSAKQDEESAEEQRKIVILNVSGKGKFRRLVAPSNVAEYLERIRTIAKATGTDDHVFTTYKGEPAESLYKALVKDLLTETKLLKGPAGTERSTYCFRHTYATLRLSEGVDVYLLAEQMGTSVQMIEKHYGHITPVKNADRILLGMHTWEQTETEEAEEGDADSDRVNKVEATSKSAKAGAANKARMNKGAAQAEAAQPQAAGHGRVNKATATRGPRGRR
jgi:integrase